MLLYIYFGTVVLSYLVSKKSTTTMERKLKNNNLWNIENEKDKKEKNTYIKIMSCIPIINVFFAIGASISESELFETYKEAQCQIMVKNNDELKEKYKRACIENNSEQKRKIEQEIIEYNLSMTQELNIPKIKKLKRIKG